MEYSGNGYLKVRVTTVGGTVPTVGAEVTISEYSAADDGGDEVLYTLRTGRSGVTPTVMLPAPRMSESLAPGAAQPYGTYAIRVEKAGYYPVELAGVPVFDRVTSVQSVDLLPSGRDSMNDDGEDGEAVLYENVQNGYLAPSGGDRDDLGGQNGRLSGEMTTEGEDDGNE